MELNIVSLVSDLGAMGFIFWLVHRTTTHTIPRLAKGFENATKEQRLDYKEMSENQRNDFMELMREQREGFFEELKREREFSTAHMDRLTSTVKELFRDSNDT